MNEGETLLGFSRIYLFGRPLIDLKLNAKYDDGLGLPRGGENNFLRNQLVAQDATFARIFAFSFEGVFQELSQPTIFLVHGPGFYPDEPSPTNAQGQVEYDRLARSPGSSARSGLGRQTGALAKDIKVWAYDKGDFSMRLDMEAGPLEDILLSAEIDDDGLARSSGSRSSGSRSSGSRSSGSRSSGSRSSGVMARSSGWMPRK